jgi:hypothetical protein
MQLTIGKLMLAYCLLSIANWVALLSPKQLTDHKENQGNYTHH